MRRAARNNCNEWLGIILILYAQFYLHLLPIHNVKLIEDNSFSKNVAHFIIFSV